MDPHAGGLRRTRGAPGWLTPATIRGRERGMTSDDGRCREYEEFRRIDAAFRAGDFEGLRAALGSPHGFPDVSGPITIGHCLEYAIYHSPLSFIRLLLDRGADPNYENHAGFPSLIAALTCLRSVPRSPRRPDAHAILELLLDA